MTMQATKPVTKPAATPPRMILSAVTRGRVEKPLRVLLFGTEGLGKSTFAAGAPDPIFITTEDGTAHLDVARFPEPKSWHHVLEAVDTLTNEEHPYKTLVIDTLDWLEPLVWEDVCSRPDDKGRKHKSITGFGYGKGYDAALDLWRVLASRMERMRMVKSMGVVLLAHTEIKTFKNPQGDDFDRYQLKLHKHPSGLFREWCDVVLFGAYETFVDDSSGRAKGVSTGARVIHTQRTAAWDAKNRHDLPETLPLDWTAFAEAVAAHKPADPEHLRARIREMLAQVEDAELKAKVEKVVAEAGDDAAKLAKYKDTLTARLNIKAQEQAQ